MYRLSEYPILEHKNRTKYYLENYKSKYAYSSFIAFLKRTLFLPSIFKKSI